jgi:hypothetical protein
VPGLATIEQLKAVLNVREGEFDEATAQLFLDSASEMVGRYCERTFIADPAPTAEGEDDPSPVTRTVRARGLRMIRIPDVRRLDQVDADGTVLLPTQWELVGREGDPAVAIRLNLDARVLVLTGLFGWAPPPAPVVKATLTLAARSYEERDARFADQVIDPVGSVSNYFRQLPASVVAELGLYRYPGIS